MQLAVARWARLAAGRLHCVVVVVVLHLPGSAGWLTPMRGAHEVLLRCLHSFMYPSALLSSSVILIMVLAAFFSFSTFSWNISLNSMVCPHLSFITGHIWRMCSWVSVSFLQNLHMRSFSHPFLKLFFTGSIDALVLIMAEHSFLFNFSIYIGLLSALMSVLRSFQCFIFVFSTYTFSIRSMNLVFISSWRYFFKLVLVSTIIWSFTLNSSAILLISFLRSLLFGDVTSLMRASPFRLSIRLAWRIFFFFIVSSMG